jgi:anti-sigma regulatory factor (Ser/Thr protein kinase)
MPFVSEALGVRRARQFAADECASLAPPQRDDVLLCVSELVTNAVVHARSAGELRITVRSDGVRIEVDDESPDTPRLAADGRPVGGRGLRIVDQLAASWGHATRPGGKTVWAELPVAPGPSDRGPPPTGVDEVGGA